VFGFWRIDIWLGFFGDDQTASRNAKRQLIVAVNDFPRIFIADISETAPFLKYRTSQFVLEIPSAVS
jgi:hypothetical protein